MQEGWDGIVSSLVPQSAEQIDSRGESGSAVLGTAEVIEPDVVQSSLMGMETIDIVVNFARHDAVATAGDVDDCG